MSKLKIGLISREFPNETYYGGIAEHYYLLAKELSKKNDVTVISSSKIKNSNRKMDNFQVKRILEEEDKYYSFLEYSKSIFDKVKKEQFDIIESPEFKAEGFFISEKFPLITKFHSPLFKINDSQPLNRWETDILQEKIELEQAKNSIGLISPSKSLANDIKKKEKAIKKIEVIPYGLNFLDLKNSTTKQNIFNQEKISILYIGRIEFRKGVITLSQAIAKLNNNDIELIIIGKDTKYGGKSIVKEIKKIFPKTKIFPFVPREEVFAYMQLADIIVVPSIWDNLPFVCLQAMYSGTPLIVSNSGGLPEMISNEKTGLVFETNNINCLINKINFCIDNKEIVKKYAKNAKKKALAKYSIKKCAKLNLNYYKRCLNEKI